MEWTKSIGRLFNYIWGVIKNKKSHLYRINGIEDHIHILTHLHPTIALSDFIKDIKVSSSLMIKERKLFPKFNGWQIGYGAFTYSIDAKEKLIKHRFSQQLKKTKYPPRIKELF